ncbi:protein ORANGE-GREEN, chloroplastic-like isoform X2 [Actinidia eriantha]|uniref:protein ORANGE-GREEN, chloroplastic-like isoform X2 n=1 Tax=Actinidia eriantha TaxID=165200 RepID=UPI002582F7F9|nr:protein ORANGE-GREEN, chloroplastic-like isoform X2 [Actinidia eriantha]
MVCSSRLLAVSYPTTRLIPHNSPLSNSRFLQGKLRSNYRWRSMASEPEGASFAPPIDAEVADKNAAGFCIIEGPETVQDFAKMELLEIQDNIRSRRNKIFLHMEEVRRLRIQQRIKNAELGIQKDEQENELPNFPSFIPFLPPLLELKLGLGGTSYEDFIRSVHLPTQLSQVDPIVASFSGGAVGVISALMVVEINNVKLQEHKRCKYCLGTGYLACARCSSTGALVLIEPISTVYGGDQPLEPPKTERCSNCSGSGKVMCPTCLCTGMAMASEHDPRIDPFD